MILIVGLIAFELLVLCDLCCMSYVNIAVLKLLHASGIEKLLLFSYHINYYNMSAVPEPDGSLFVVSCGI